jgi:hypothetical protein
MGGSRFARTLAGPGVVLSQCDHAPAVSDGVNFKGVQTPGLSFTGFADAVSQAIDLREQLREFAVTGRTRDGIGIEVRAFASFCIDSGSEGVRLGQPFPFRKSAAFLALHKASMVEHVGDDQMLGRMERRSWEDLPRVLGTRILRTVISRYRFDDLCSPFLLHEDPREEIEAEFRTEMRAALKPCGIDLISAWISNLLPTEKSRRTIFEQRIQSWRVHWVRHVMRKQADGQRSRLRQIEKARAHAQVGAIRNLTQRLARLQETKTVISSGEVLDLFIDMIEQMAMRPLIRRLLPDDARDSIESIRRGKQV